MAAAVNKKNLTHEYISKSGCFTISAVAQDAPITFIGLFGFRTGRDLNKFEKVKYRLCPCGAPIVLEHTISALEIKVTQSVDIGSHTLFIGEVSCGHVLSNGKPMTYDYYHTVLKGKTPRNATTYMPPENGAGRETMTKYVCKVCGYIYDPAVGDPDNGVPPGTPFEKIPDTWVCPACGVGKKRV